MESHPRGPEGHGRPANAARGEGQRAPEGGEGRALSLSSTLSLAQTRDRSLNGGGQRGKPPLTCVAEKKASSCSGHNCGSCGLCGATVVVIENIRPVLAFQSYIRVMTLVPSDDDKPIPQVQEVLDDSPFFVREDGVSIMNGANEGMTGTSSVSKIVVISRVIRKQCICYLLWPCCYSLVKHDVSALPRPAIYLLQHSLRHPNNAVIHQSVSFISPLL